MNESLVHPVAGMTTTDLLKMSGDRTTDMNTDAAGVLLGGVAFGTLGIVVFFSGLWSKGLDIGEITVFKAFLILGCVLQTLSTWGPAIVILGSYCGLEHCLKLWIIWLAYRRCVVLLHLLVALEFILTNQSPGSPKTVPPYLSVTVVFMINFVCILFYDVLEAGATVGVVALALTLWIFKARCFSAPTAKPFNKVLCLAFVSFAGTYCPSFVMECMILNGNFLSTSAYHISLCLTNLCLGTSMLLCWITCRRTFEEAPLAIEISSHHLPQARF